jgi:hypothetical protein
MFVFFNLIADIDACTLLQLNSDQLTSRQPDAGGAAMHVQTAHTCNASMLAALKDNSCVLMASSNSHAVQLRRIKELSP